MADDSSRHGFAYRFFWFLGVVCVGSLLFVTMDVSHRISGYRAAHQGILGTVGITRCDHGMTGVVCRGDFTSVDGGVHRQGIRVNGAPQALHWNRGTQLIDPPMLLPVRIGDSGAHEAWTVEGTPWLSVSRVMMYALTPELAMAFSLWMVLRQGIGVVVRRSRGRRQNRELSFYRRMFSETPRSRRR
jgi:hypothetical protein